MNNWYHMRIMDHYRQRRHAQPLDNPMVRFTRANPLCGDSLTVDIIIREGILAEVALYGSGCVMSQASASLLAQEIHGRPVENVLQFSQDALLALIGVEVGPLRRECVMLAWHALHKGITQCLTMNA